MLNVRELTLSIICTNVIVIALGFLSINISSMATVLCSCTVCSASVEQIQHLLFIIFVNGINVHVSFRANEAILHSHP